MTFLYWQDRDANGRAVLISQHTNVGIPERGGGGGGHDVTCRVCGNNEQVSRGSIMLQNDQDFGHGKNNASFIIAAMSR